ncbi:hypothetical protein M3Y97_00785300 [Aphelenchoides bicaudatus]|nr:hypothetical protein M3Y97_00785300 [Aphelenchoides bicaudatus]
MGDIKFNSHYLGSDRGVCKIVQIVIGFVICSSLCANWYGGASCFGEGRIGFVSGLNFVLLIGNIIAFLLNLCNVAIGRLEYFFNVIASIFLVIAIILFGWWMIQYGEWGVWRIVVVAGLVVILVMFSWDSNRVRAREEHLPI